ncbi:ribosomal RNA small subunit methyltransferase A [Candidatus Peregrinibacteria bacterium]|jgi:16S rRNA (adenine1518-N6/adenine1519-N6)-dimethyltransferase|nr:ribosomal RNA small subunit methyltransferase A [Candidatus Peregrinibacteria bacterium]MBT4631660.1 ribosomal RNA small subunit methyltransferase A [Candidatus Peregrinibacteria bacterium]MBT5516788.1 ribosomal RNA small subunit methyltransferase A [Candidatus Peregrinibacteria bacterium]MBT5823930.1 ribosomal RNA small subunit methyltransferase A [Candidatus Peregrinibacteria bacterium]
MSNHRPKKQYGQNFLVDEDILAQIIEAAELTPNDLILEIGPGKGALTHALLSSGAKVTAIEIDEDLLPILKLEFGQDPNFTLTHGDALKLPPPKTPYKIVANLPYYITSPLLNHYLLEQFEGGNPPETLVIMLQKEVAEKIIAKKKHSVLSLQVHLFGTPEIICKVPAKAFRPAPKIDSAVLKITVAAKPKIQADLKKLFWLFKMSFAHKRKKLANNLAGALEKTPAEIKEMLTKLKINEDARAESLTLHEWETLFNELN